MTPQKIDLDLPVSVQESLSELWVSGGLPQGGGTECSSTSWDLLKEVTVTFLTPTIVWPQVKQQGREHSPTHHQKIGLKIY